LALRRSYLDDKTRFGLITRPSQELVRTPEDVVRFDHDAIKQAAAPRAIGPRSRRQRQQGHMMDTVELCGKERS
jgi:hypothetical protein